MNYYEHHLGDYMRDTAHLSLLEDGAYRRLIDAYYVRERPLPSDLKECCKLARAQAKAERDAVAYVLKAFFEECEEGHRQKRCDEVIAAFHDKRGKAKRSADARWEAERLKSERNAIASETHVRKACEVDAPNLQSPVPNPKEEKRRALEDARAVTGLNIEAFDRWVAYRAKRKPAINPISMVAAAQELARFGDQQADVVGHSIANTYQGLIPPKINGHQRQDAPARQHREFGK